VRAYWSMCKSIVQVALLVCLASGALHGQVLVSLGEGSGCTALQGGQTCTLTARVTGTTNFNVNWTFSPTVAGAVLGTPTVPDATGLSSDTFKAPNFISTRQTVIATVTSVVDPTAAASVQISLVPVSVTVLVTPTAVTLGAGQSQQFSATVTGISQTGVSWSINPQVGSIDPVSGFYTAPASVTVAQKVSVIATSTFDPVSTGTATVTLQAPIIQVAPSAVTLSVNQTQLFTATVSGTLPSVTWSISPQVGNIDPNSGLYTAPSTLTAAQRVTVTATSTINAGVTGTATVTLQAQAAITVTVSPSAASLTAGQTQQFTATAQNSTLGVTWSLNPLVGSIDATGLYSAPATATGSQKITVTATSVEDTTKSATATITLTGTTITVNPSTVSLSNGQQQQFSALVQNGSGGVLWSISPQTGTIDANGLYTAPALITGSVKVTVTATLVSNTSVTGTAAITLGTLTDVGVGAPNNLVQAFVTAFYRNNFDLLVSLPPLGNVKALGSTGYVQEFSDVAKTSGVKLALATISSTVPPAPDGTATPVVQLFSPLYVYYSSVGAGTAGYPLSDSLICPPFDPVNSCGYDFFDKGYALFAYANSLSTGQNFSIAGAFYTEWTNLGGLSGPGRPVDVQTTVTASTTTTATQQAFSSGAIYSITSGVNKGKTFGVVEPLYDLYVAQAGPTGKLGLPTGEVQLVSASGVYKQNFEGGALQYTSAGGPTVQLPVVAVTLTGTAGGALTLSLGQTLTVTAVPSDSNGSPLTDRAISWSTTNGKVISIQATGQSAVLTAVGGGTASVTASSGGITSPKLNLTVNAPCCQVGQGAPVSVQQAFQDAITRDKLSIMLPVPAAAVRVGSGYVQMIPSSDPSTPVIYMVAQADQSGTAYVVFGAILAQYQTLGGPTGALGYPASDASTGGTQRFVNNAALAGSPVRLVIGGILTKWASLGYETGVAGPPVADATAFSTFGANSGNQQSFQGGAIYSATGGPRAGSSYFVSGLVLTRYSALGGASGDYGMPTSDEFVTAGLHQQNFEGGNITYSVGDAAAVEHPAAKTPSVIVAPASISAGGQARLAVSGFPDNSTIRVSVSGAPDFLVTSVNGAYSWVMPVPLTAKSGTVAIHAVDTRGTSTADGTLTIKGFADNRVAITMVQGDNQTGLPGATLPMSLRIALKDASGNPVVGAPVVFQASPGAQISVSTAVTDASGQAETWLRLPASVGITAVTADAPSIAQNPISFYARSAASTLSGFPQWTEAGNTPLGRGSATIGQKGALLTAAASILRYHQNRGALPAPNGTVDPLALNQFLLSDCAANLNGPPLCDGYLSISDSGEQIVNLWRAADFTGGVDVRALAPSLPGIADLLAQGTPVLLSLGLSLNNVAAGGHYVVATGISADGSIVIQDPSPLFARSSLNDYLNGFTVAGGNWKGILTGTVEFAIGNPSGTRFLATALSQPPDLMSKLVLDLQSPAGPCGLPVDFWDAVDSAGHPATGGLISRFQVCDGLQPVYQMSLGADQPYRASITDLASNGAMTDLSGNISKTYQATRPQLALDIVAEQLSLQPGAAVNSATLTGGLAPGGAMTVFGTGLSGAGTATTADLDGSPVLITSTTTFQLNGVIPIDMPPGTHTLNIQSAFGSASQSVSIAAVAPAVFLVGNPLTGAVANQDGSLNGPASPAARGKVVSIYATGLGAVNGQTGLAQVGTPVTVVLNGQELAVDFAGLTPGIPGEYQVNVLIPLTTPPGLGIPLTLKQGGYLSNTVTLALQ